MKGPQPLMFVALALGCVYKPAPHSPYTGEQYAPIDAATLAKLENGFARLHMDFADDEDVVLLRSHIGKHVKIDGKILYSELGTGVIGVRILIAPADAPDRKVLLHYRDFFSAKPQQQMMTHLANAPDDATAYVRVHENVGEPDPFELHAIGFPDGKYLAY